MSKRKHSNPKKVRRNKYGVPFRTDKKPTVGELASEFGIRNARMTPPHVDLIQGLFRKVEPFGPATPGIEPLFGIDYLQRFAMPTTSFMQQSVDAEQVMADFRRHFHTIEDWHRRLYDEANGTSTRDEIPLFSDHEMGFDGKPAMIPMNAAAHRLQAEQIATARRGHAGPRIITIDSFPQTKDPNDG